VIEEIDDETAPDGVSRTLAALARADGDAADASAWSRRSLAASRPILATHARREYRRRVSLALVAALIPLPIIAMYDRILLGWLYEIADTLLPSPIATLAVGGYAATTSLLLALTYAAIPVLVDRTQPWRVAR
jgi:hypothetical protein